MLDEAQLDALRRAGRRALYHLLRAGLETVKAVEAFLEELSEGEARGPTRIEVE